MKIRTKERVVLETAEGPLTILPGKVLEVDSGIGKDLAKRGLAEMEPVPYFIKKLNQTILIFNNRGQVDRVSAENTMLGFTPYELYLIKDKKPEVIEAILNVKRVFPGSMVEKG